MAVDLDKKYYAVGTDSSDNLDRIHVRFDAESFAEYDSNNSAWIWKIRCPIYVCSGNAIGNRRITRVIIETPDIYSPITMASASGLSIEGRSFQHVNVTGASAYYPTYQNDLLYIENYNPTEPRSHGSQEVRVRVEFFNGLSTNEVSIKTEMPSVTYGGIDTSSPSITSLSVVESSISQTSATVKYKVSAPYKTSLLARVYERNAGTYGYTKIAEKIVDEDAVSVYEKQFDIHTAFDNINLKQITSYKVECQAYCDNRSSSYAKQTSVFTTLPYYAEQIVSDDNVYVNEGEYTSLSLSVLPSNATYKVLSVGANKGSRFSYRGSGDESWKRGGDGFVQTNNAIIKGDEASFSPDTLIVKTVDGSDISKEVNIYVCRPATSINPTINDKKILESTTFQIEYSVLPEGSTDAVQSNVSFSSQNTSVATVSSTGLITAVGQGITTVRVTLARRTGASIYADITVRVSGLREWISILIPDFLTYEFIDDYNNNLVLLKGYLESMSFSVDELETPQTGLGKLTPLFRTKEIITTIESNITKIYEAVENAEESTYLTIANQYYLQTHTWDGVVTDARQNVVRWVLWMQNMYNYCAPDVPTPVIGQIEEAPITGNYIYTDEYGNETIIPADEVNEP